MYGKMDFDGNRWSIGGHDLHCGDCFDVLINGVWVSARIEQADNGKWYFEDLPPVWLVGCQARIR